MVANGKRRKTRIFRLEQDEGVIEGRNKLRVISLNTIRIFLEVQKLADYHSMSLWWRIFLKLPIQKVRYASG
jgi:hypothetical protein